MKIVADSQIPLVQQAFARIGTVTVYEGREIAPAVVKDADVLLIRSITPVTAALLKNSRVRFVASATSGIDHIDNEYLRSTGIGFAAAQGSNAQAVVEYVLSSLFVLADQQGFDPFDMTAGIIGCGQVGSRLMAAFQGLGIDCLVNDPPLRDLTGDMLYAGLGEVIANADLVSLHVPLTDDGKYPTRALVDDKLLARMRRNVVLINTSRGGVIREDALKQHIKNYGDSRVVLDVWDHEPDIDRALLASVAIGTPHIAGYGLDAKIKATEMIYAETCRYFNLPRDWQPSEDLFDQDRREIRIDRTMSDREAIPLAVLSRYDVRGDAAALRQVLEIEPHQTGAWFDTLRKNYPARRGFAATTVVLPKGRTALADSLKALGFNISWQ